MYLKYLMVALYVFGSVGSGSVVGAVSSVCVLEAARVVVVGRWCCS